MGHVGHQCSGMQAMDRASGELGLVQGDVWMQHSAAQMLGHRVVEPLLLCFSNTPRSQHHTHIFRHASMPSHSLTHLVSQVVDPIKASYGVDNALYAVSQLAQVGQGMCHSEGTTAGAVQLSQQAAQWKMPQRGEESAATVRAMERAVRLLFGIV